MQLLPIFEILVRGNALKALLHTDYVAPLLIPRMTKKWAGSSSVRAVAGSEIGCKGNHKVEMAVRHCT